MRNEVCNPERYWKLCDKCGLSEHRRTVVLRGNGHVDGRGTVERDGYNIYWRGVPTEEPEKHYLTGSSIKGTRTLSNSGTTESSRISRVPLLLFLGEAPGEQEDVSGLPFQGEAGRVFNYSLSLCTVAFRFEVTNVVGCRPATYGRFGQLVNRQPTAQEIKACSPRLTQLFRRIVYDGIIYLGATARENCDTTLPTTNLLHPAHILRKEYKLHDIKLFAREINNYVSTNFE